jgi:predicted CxxxxCH...CXXCH cytochrome family protein
VNGTLELSGTGGSCTGCHGDPARTPAAIAPAPPRDSKGNTATTAAGVGAHQRHLTGGPVRGPLACSECHAVPTDIAHAGEPLQLTWGSLARAGGATPTFDTVALTCANYCHGATLSAGSITAPVWNRADGTQAACGTCHGLPPGGAHPRVGSSPSGCASCHPATVNPDGSINVPGGRHVDGSVQVTGHGDYTSPAVHGPAFLDAVAVNPATPSCTGCHGLTYDGIGAAPSCNACHASAGWAMPWQSNCSFCHGARNASTRAGYAVHQHPTWSAPPDDVGGRLGGTNSAARTGAHQAHLTGVMSGGSSIAAPFACETCHAVPTDISHVDGSAARAVVALSSAGQAGLPALLGSYDPGTGTCATYCHGASMSGGSVAGPRWSIINGTQAACGACHGLPPAFPHPAVPGGVTACSGCHAGTVNASGAILVAGGLHVNGLVEVAGTGGCTGCHGDPARTSSAIAPAPPLDTRGNTATTAAGVGAHQRHLTGGVVRGPFACTECHVVPGDLAHASQPLQLTWGPLATANGASASFNASALTCANYCHGSGGSVPAPIWNKVDGTQAACGACHGVPPPAPHPTVTGGLPTCNGCHAGTVNPDGSISLAGNLHVNGTVELAGTGGCTGCHGDPARTPLAIAPAPPKDTKGNAVTTAAGVGAHQRHLVAGSVRGPIPCTECHVVPGDLAHATQPLQLTWGPLARTGGITPSFNPASLTCTNYCHGTAALGGTVPQPMWNVVNDTQAACGSCHGLPPPAPHPTVTGGLTACVGCHAATLNPDGSVNVAGGTHVDGVIQATGHGDYSSPAVHGPQFFAYLGGTGINCASCHGATYGGGMAPSCNACHLSNGWTASWQTNCSFCHGTRNAFTKTTTYSVTTQPTLSAPPDDIQGRLTGSNLPSRTGAHLAHLTGTTLSGQSYAVPFPCQICHTVPTDLSHIGGSTARAIVTLSGGSYSAATGTCTTACHGVPPSPAWSGSITQCNGCHGIGPDTGVQIDGYSAHVYHWSGGGMYYPCQSCHSATSMWVVQGGVQVDVLRPDKTLHVNGRVDVVFDDGGTWNATAGTCVTACHRGATMIWR